MFDVTSRVVIAGGDQFITFLVVAGIIIAQIVRAIKKANKQGPSQAPGQTSDQAIGPEQELQAFLQRLAGGTPQPPPVARAVAPPPVARAVAPPRVPQPKPHAPTPPVRVAAPTPVAVRTTTPSPAVKSNIRAKPSSRGSDIAKLLSDSGSVRDVIVLREILGPPLALRGTNAMTAQR